MKSKTPITSNEKFQFLLVGASNTLFGIADTFVWTWLCVRYLPAYPATATSVAIGVSTGINITVSFMSYRLLVFRSKGSLLQEYLRSFLVYVPNMIISVFAALPLTLFLQRMMARPQFAPYAAQACIVLCTLVFSFWGHKNITFRKKSSSAASAK